MADGQAAVLLEDPGTRQPVKQGGDDGGGDGVDSHGNGAVHGGNPGNGFGQAEDIGLEGPADGGLGEDVDEAG